MILSETAGSVHAPIPPASAGKLHHSSVYAEDCELSAESDDARCEALEQAENDCIGERYVLLTGLYLFWVMSWIGASVPLYIMCCCTERPQEVCSHHRLLLNHAA